ncbi:MAG: hypothetical protein H7338_22645 [Candidatus Sericytochromatia bacterium]|nr:hypothetical protein [Candidatus Sericytochromatia bacterium]
MTRPHEANRMQQRRRTWAGCVGLALGMALAFLPACQPGFVGPRGAEIVGFSRPLSTKARVAIAIQAFRPPVGRLKTQATVSDIDSYAVTLNAVSDNREVASQRLPATPADGTLIAAGFDTVPDGDYYVTVDAQDSLRASLLAPTGPVRSTNTVRVTTPNVRYGDDPDGHPADSLLVSLTLAGGGVVPVGRISANVQNMAGGTVHATLVQGIPTASVTTFATVAASFLFRKLNDGVYGIWGFSEQSGPAATPAYPGTGTVTVATQGASVSGALSLQIPSPVIATVAGTGLAEGSAPLAEAISNFSIGIDAAGNQFFGDMTRNQVRVSSPLGGSFCGRTVPANQVTRVVGGGMDVGDGIDPLSARLRHPRRVIVGATGHLFILDDVRRQVLCVPATGTTLFGSFRPANRLFTVCGNGQTTPAADGTLANQSGMDLREMTVDSQGNVIVQDLHSLRMIPTVSGSHFGIPMTAGQIHTVIGSQNDATAPIPGTTVGPGVPCGFVNSVATDSNGNLYFARLVGGIYMVPQATSTAFDGVSKPANTIAVLYGQGAYILRSDTAGNLYCRSVAGAAMLSRTTQTAFGTAMSPGGFYELTRTAPGGPAFTEGGLGTATGMNSEDIAVDGAGNLLLPVFELRRLILLPRVTTSSYPGGPYQAARLYTLAGSGREPWDQMDAAGLTATLSPESLAATPMGDLVWRSSDRLYLQAAATGTFYGQSMTAGYVYRISGGGTETEGGFGPQTTGLYVETVAADPQGNLFFFTTNKVYAIARQDTSLFGVATQAGHRHTVAGGGAGGDGGAALGAQLREGGIAINGRGDLFLALGTQIRMVPRRAGTYFGVTIGANQIDTVVGGNAGPVLRPGDALRGGILDSVTRVGCHDDYLLFPIRRQAVQMATDTAKRAYGALRPTQQIGLVAGDENAAVGTGDGGPASAAGLASAEVGPWAVGPAGHLYLTSLNVAASIRMVTPDGNIYRVSGPDNLAVGVDGNTPNAVNLGVVQGLVALPTGGLAAIIDKHIVRY